MPMLVLVANLGSTSFKFKLLDMEHDGEVIARGGYERIGQPGSLIRNARRRDRPDPERSAE